MAENDIRMEREGLLERAVFGIEPLDRLFGVSVANLGSYDCKIEASTIYRLKCAWESEGNVGSFASLCEPALHASSASRVLHAGADSHLLRSRSYSQEDFRISDTLAGVLGSGFIFGFTVAAPVFAHLSKHYSPYKLMSIGLFIWCGACVLCGMSYEYWVLLLARIITGVGEASFAGTFVQLVL